MSPSSVCPAQSWRGRPPAREIELDGFEWLGAHAFFLRMACEEHVALALQPVHVENLRDRVEKPEVPHACGGVDAALARVIDDGRRGRQDLADPIRVQLEESGAGQTGHSFEAPAGKIPYENVRDSPACEVKLGLGKDAPPAGIVR